MCDKIKICAKCGESDSNKLTYQFINGVKHYRNMCKKCKNANDIEYREIRMNRIDVERRQLKRLILKKKKEGFIYCMNCKLFKNKKDFPTPSVREKRGSMPKCNQCAGKIKELRICECCGKEFYAYKYRIIHIYCSLDCGKKMHYNRMMGDPEWKKKRYMVARNYVMPEHLYAKQLERERMKRRAKSKNLDDNYVIQSLQSNSKLKFKDIRKHPLLIELQRNRLILHRFIINK